MAIVTAISFYYDKDEAVIATDEGRYILTLRDVKELKLKQGNVLDYEMLEQVEQKDENLRCLKKLLGTVSRTNISKRKLMYKYKKDFSREAIDFAVKKLEAVGYINDSEYAKRHAQLLAKKLIGKAKIKSELRAKGFELEDIEAAIEELETDSGENIDSMLSLLQRRYRTKAFDKAKAYVYLRSRGYDGDEIKSAISRYLEDIEDVEENAESDNIYDED